MGGSSPISPTLIEPQSLEGGTRAPSNPPSPTTNTRPKAESTVHFRLSSSSFWAQRELETDLYKTVLRGSVLQQYRA